MWLLREEGSGDEAEVKFVSILLFVDVAPEVCGVWITSMMKAMFQSFFSWMWLLRSALVSFLENGNLVSILLFVDVAPEGSVTNLPAFGFRVSILLFVDVAPEAFERVFFIQGFDGFNPSFRGCGS